MSTRPLTWRDYYQLVTTVAFFVIGVNILLRSIAQPRLLTWAIGGSFLAFSFYRLYFIFNYFRFYRRLRGNNQ